MDSKKPRPQPPDIDVPEELEPGALPVEPDQGMVPTHIPEDPEGARLVDADERAWFTLGARGFARGALARIGRSGPAQPGGNPLGK
jgi:hypothetical protein